MRWTAARVAGASGLRHRRPDQLPRVTRKTLRRATWASEPSTGSSDGAASPPVTTNAPSTAAQGRHRLHRLVRVPRQERLWS